MDEVHVTSAPVFATVYNWVNEFKRDRKSTKHEHRSRLPVEISARWVPRLLSEENKRNCVVDSEVILTFFRRNPDEFLRRYITANEIWMGQVVLVNSTLACRQNFTK